MESKNSDKVISFSEAMSSKPTQMLPQSFLGLPVSAYLKSRHWIFLTLVLCCSWGYSLKNKFQLKQAQKQFLQLSTQEQKAVFAKKYAHLELGGLINLELAAQSVTNNQFDRAQHYFQQAYKGLKNTLLGKQILLAQYCLEPDSQLAYEKLTQLSQNKANTFFLQQQIESTLAILAQRKLEQS